MVGPANDAVSDAARLFDDRFIFERRSWLRMPGSAVYTCVLTNLSRRGYRVVLDDAICEGALAWLDIPGFRPMSSRIVWATDQQVGGVFDLPVAAETFAVMLRFAKNRDRLGDEIII